MIVFFGTQNYGKVDHVPGLFFVASSFFYINFVPLFPTGSYLIIDDGKQRGFRLGLSGKSVVFAYLRALLLCGGIVAVALGLMEVSKHPHVAAGLIGAGVVAGLLFFLTYKITKPSPRRALRLASQAGIPPEYVAQFFVHADLPVDELAERPYDEVSRVDDLREGNP